MWLWTLMFRASKCLCRVYPLHWQEKAVEMCISGCAVLPQSTIALSDYLYVWWIVALWQLIILT